MKARQSLSSFLIFSFITTAFLLFAVTQLATAGPVAILYNENSPRQTFGVNTLTRSLGGNVKILRDLPEQRDKDTFYIILGTHDNDRHQHLLSKVGLALADSLQPEGFSIQKHNNLIAVTGSDHAGVMYGCFELVEQFKLYGLEHVQEIQVAPHMAMRGIKMNIPLDVRTPSYTDMSDAAQNNIANMWDMDFWKAQIDLLSRMRYNYISIWSLHPFPSMVKVPEYPDVALDNVLKSTTNWDELYDLEGIGYDSPDILRNTTVVKTISIDDKLKFWQQVMAYGKSRNIDFYIITWNIYTYGIDGKYGITDDINNETTRDYFRRSVKAMFTTYPDLAGIGLTTGENIPGASAEEKENWAFATYGQGVLDAAAALPDRKIRLIHRQHYTGAQAVMQQFQPLREHPNIDFLFSFKYAKAHVFSSVKQPYHIDFVKDIKKAGDQKTIWTLRNDDTYYFRWGAPDFVRTFIKNIPHDISQGFYYGSDQWIWGREFLSKYPTTPRQLEIGKHWYDWMLWGRLGYDPNVSNERFIGILQVHFPNVNAEHLFAAWQHASMTYPLTTGFHWGSLDFQWYIEACKGRAEFAQTATGFHDVNRFITLGPHPCSGNQSILDYVNMLKDSATTPLTTPVQVADNLHQHADQAIALLDSLQAKEHTELWKTLHDIRCMALLGKYYAHKINGAVELHKFRELGHNKEHQNKSVQELTTAAEYWKQYIETAKVCYQNPLWTNRVGTVDWDQIYTWVLDDITIAENANQEAAR